MGPGVGARWGGVTCQQAPSTDYASPSPPGPGVTCTPPPTAQGECKVKALGRKEARAPSQVGGCVGTWPGGRMLQINKTDRGQ